MHPDIWIYSFKNILTDHQLSIVNKYLVHFIKQWNTHGESVTGFYKILRKKFVAVYIETDQTVSGCSIDSVVKVFKELRDNHGLDALDFNLVHFKDGNTVKSVSREIFSELVSQGKITDQTIVFDTALQNKSDFFNSRFEIPFEVSWHKKLFKTAA